MNADRLMRNMIQSMGMGIPFGGGLFDMDDGANMPGQHQPRGHYPSDPLSSIMPHGFMSPMSMMMMDPFQSMQQAMSMASNGPGNNGFSYCSSSVTTYTTDEHGRPQIYQQSNEVKQGPSGIKETKSAVRDSRTGHQELAIGHHLNDKARIKKKSKNAYTGEEEQAEDLINLEEEEADAFEQNWQQQARNVTSYNQLGCGSTGPSRNRLAITNGSASSSRTDANPYYTTSHANEKAIKKEKKKRKSKEEKYK